MWEPSSLTWALIVDAEFLLECRVKTEGLLWVVASYMFAMTAEGLIKKCSASASTSNSVRPNRISLLLSHWDSVDQTCKIGNSTKFKLVFVHSKEILTMLFFQSLFCLFICFCLQLITILVLIIINSTTTSNIINSVSNY